MPPRPLRSASYARVLCEVMGGLSNMALWLRIPLVSPTAGPAAQPARTAPQQSSVTAATRVPSANAATTANGMHAARRGEEAATSAAGRPPPGFQRPAVSGAADGGTAYVDDPWQWWHHVRALCGHSTKLGVLLVVPVTLTGASVIDRWLGEPVKAVLLPTAAFLTNRKGFPVLSRQHQELLAKVFKFGIQVNLNTLSIESGPKNFLCSPCGRLSCSY